MENYKLVHHSVKSASYVENREKEKQNNVEVSVEGGILIPKNLQKARSLAVQLKFNMGKPEERFHLELETLSTFEIGENIGNYENDEEEIRSKCIPVALAELRKTVEKVTEAYGLPAVELPPFEEEIKDENSSK